MPPRRKVKAPASKGGGSSSTTAISDLPAKAKAVKRKSPSYDAPVRAKVPKVSKPAAPVREPKAPSVGPDSKPSVARKRAIVRPVYDDVWRSVYLAGTEWEQLQMVYAIDWDFEHLDDALTEGNLEGKKVYLFGATEPQLIMRDENDIKGEVIPVPVIVAVVTDVPPPATVGVKSVQRTQEEIIPMAAMRMGWHAYAPENVQLSRRFKPTVHVLKCNERKARLRNMGEAEVHKYDYVLPYFIRPDQVEDVTVDTVVQVLADLDGQKAPLMCEFDFELDDLQEFVVETIKENELDESKHAEPLKQAIRDAVKATKLKYKAEKEERKKRIDAISQEEREAIKSMKLLKFYPQNEWPDVSKIKSPFINRYYLRATEVL